MSPARAWTRTARSGVERTNHEAIVLPLFSFLTFNLDKIKKGKPKNEVLERLAGKIPQEWKALGRRLKVEDTELYAIDKKEDQLQEKVYTMLMKWKQAKGEEATFLVLYNALCDPLVRRKDLAEEFCLCLP